jgi:hypothetical protein
MVPKRTVEFRGLIIERLGHNSVGIYGKKVIYIDPFHEVLRGDEKKPI